MKNMPAPKTVDLRGEAQIFAHLEGGVANVNAVQKSNDVNEKEVRQDATHDAPACSYANCVHCGWLRYRGIHSNFTDP